MTFPDQHLWELDPKGKNYKDDGFRRDVVRIMHRRTDFEDESWEMPVFTMVQRYYDYSSYSRNYEEFYQRLINAFKNGSLMVITALAMLANKGKVTEQEFWKKSSEAMVLDVEQFFKDTFAQMEAYKKKLKNDESEKPLSFVKTKDYSGLKAYLKNSRKNPELYPLDKRGDKEYTIMHLAARMMDEKALKLMFDFKECDELKDAMSDECLSPLALFLYKCDGKHQDIFRTMIRSGCDLLHCNDDIHDCPLYVILKRLKSGESEYLPFLEDAIGILKEQGRLEEAFFEPISPARRRERSPSFDEDGRTDPLNEELASEENEERRSQGEERQEEEQQGEEQGEEDASDEVVESDIYSESEDDEELFGLRGFTPYLRRMRSLFDRSRDNVLFNGLLRDRNIDAIQIVLKHVPLPEDGKQSAIPKLIPRSDSWDIDATGVRIILDILLKRGADINGKDRRGRTALMKAVLAENVDLTSLLASKGGNSSIADKDGETPLSSALRIDNKEIIDILKKERLFARLASFPRSVRSPRPNDTDAHSESKCVICYERPAEVIFAPCGHKVVCKRDCRKLFEMPEERRCCPLDKEKIESFVVNVYH